MNPMKKKHRKVTRKEFRAALIGCLNDAPEKSRQKLAAALTAYREVRNMQTRLNRSATAKFLFEAIEEAMSKRASPARIVRVAPADLTKPHKGRPPN
jgi:hypothetical protein